MNTYQPILVVAHRKPRWPFSVCAGAVAWVYLAHWTTRAPRAQLFFFAVAGGVLGAAFVASFWVDSSTIEKGGTLVRRRGIPFLHRTTTAAVDAFKYVELHAVRSNRLVYSVGLLCAIDGDPFEVVTCSDPGEARGKALEVARFLDLPVYDLTVSPPLDWRRMEGRLVTAPVRFKDWSKGELIYTPSGGRARNGRTYEAH